MQKIQQQVDNTKACCYSSRVHAFWEMAAMLSGGLMAKHGETNPDEIIT